MYQYAKDEFYTNLVLEACEDDVADCELPNDQLEITKSYITCRLASEMGWRFERGDNPHTIVTDWLQGLAINIPFYNHEIVELAKNGGFVFAYGMQPNSSFYDKYYDSIAEGYWCYMGQLVLRHMTFRGLLPKAVNHG